MNWGGLGAALGSGMAAITDSGSYVIDGALDVVASFAGAMRCIFLPAPVSIKEDDRPSNALSSSPRA